MSVTRDAGGTVRNLKSVGRFLQMVRTSAMQGNDEEGKNQKDNLEEFS